MRNSRINPATKGIIYLLGASALILMHSTSIISQTRHVSPNDPRSASQRELNDREWTLYHIRENIDKHFTSEERVSLVKQVKEDFRQIQVINNQMMSRAAAGQSLDYKNISEVTGEIKKRAGRLKLYLALPEAEDEAKSAMGSRSSGGEPLKAALDLLDHSIMSFVTNPLFQKAAVLDLRLSTRASHDLSSIIELSASIKKSAEQLHKLPQNR